MRGIHNFFGASVSLEYLRAMIRGIVKFLHDDGNRLHEYNDVAALIAGRDVAKRSPRFGAGGEMARSELACQTCIAMRIRIALWQLQIHQKREL